MSVIQKPVLLVLSAALAAAFLVGCGAGPSPSGASDAIAAEADGGARPLVPASTPSTEPVQSFSAVDQATWQVTEADGYKTTGTLARENPARIDDVAVHDDLIDRTAIAETCESFDGETDALVPVYLSLKNDTAGFSNSAQVAFTLDSSYRSSNIPPTMDVIAGYSDGPECVTMGWMTAGGDDQAWVFSCELEPGKKCSGYNYVILKDYFTPANPDGDFAVFDGARFFARVANDLGDEVTAKGMGARADRLLVDIPLNGLPLS
jgi:hypothetical protein